MDVVEGLASGLPTCNPWWRYVILVTNTEKPTKAAKDVAYAWPHFDPEPAELPGGVSMFHGPGPTFITLCARKYAGYPREDEDTRGDRIDWLIECLNVLDGMLKGNEIIAVQWVKDPEQRTIIENWGKATTWIKKPKPPKPGAWPCSVPPVSRT